MFCGMWHGYYSLYDSLALDQAALMGPVALALAMLMGLSPSPCDIIASYDVPLQTLLRADIAGSFTCLGDFFWAWDSSSKSLGWILKSNTNHTLR